MERRVAHNPTGSHFVCLPKSWYDDHVMSGWDGDIVKMKRTARLILAPKSYEESQNLVMCRVPLRIPLGGGGTDLPEYYSSHNGGMWISGAITSYIYIILKKRFEEQSKFVYSETQYVDKLTDFTHPVLRAVFAKYDILEHIELVSLADLPAHLGLGSSGAFTVGLLNAVHAFLNITDKSASDVAEEAYEIERLVLGRRVGKQDQYASSLGGLRLFNSDSSGNITHKTLNIPDLHKWLLLFYVDKRAVSADEALQSMTESDRESIASIGRASLDALLAKDFEHYGRLMNKHWIIKSRSQPEHFSKLIQHAQHHGALGGKLCGAGLGGSVLLVCPPKYQFSVISAMKSALCKYIPFKFEMFGAECY